MSGVGTTSDLPRDAGDEPVGFVPLGNKDGTEYAPNYSFSGEYINDTHHTIYRSVEEIAGWLQPADALKLYELGYFSSGPILEIGTYRGKSTTIIASALRDAAKTHAFISLDIDADALTSARRTLIERGLGERVQLVRGSIEALFHARPDLSPQFVFLDGDHTVKGVRRDLAALEPHVPAGALLFFHDYVDVRYGIASAVQNTWVERECTFSGAFGCAALFQRNTGPASAVELVFADLTNLAPLKVQFRSRVVAPTVAWLRVRRVRNRLGDEQGHPG